jgi:hypothetical protein
MGDGAGNVKADDVPRLKGCLPARLAPLTTETAVVSTSGAISATGPTLALGTSFVNVNCAAFEIRAVQPGDGPVI